MSKDLTPDAWLTGWTFSTPNITLPKTAITGLSDAMCDATTTGDIRQFLMLLLTTLKAKQDALSSANKPEEMLITETATSSQRTFTVRFFGAQASFSLASEP